MEKRLYGKPLMSLEQFTPSEYVATCWCIPEGACFTSLYYDKAGWFGIRNENHDNGEQNLGHATHGKIVFNTDVEAKPTSNDNINDGNYWDYYSTYYFGPIPVSPYHEKISGNIFNVTDKNGVTHYFNQVEDAGNHS